jgi:hypothetical protein
VKAPRVPWLWFLVLGVLPVDRLPAQTVPDDINYCKSLVFRIPFETEAGSPRMKEIQLYVSTDQGRNWQPSARVLPEQGFFTFTAERDGLYWFAVRTIDLLDRPYPATMDGARPGRKVIVDTHPPVVDLRPLPAREGTVGVSWDIRDDNLDVASLRLEYRLSGSAEWRPLNPQAVATGQYSWRPDTNAGIEVRLHVKDRADNATERTTAITAGADGAGGDGAGGGARRGSPDPAEGARRGSPDPAETSDRRSPDPANPRRRAADPADSSGVHMVNSKRISLNYQVRDKGPSGAVVELWYTSDSGRSWQRYGQVNDEPPFVFEVSGEGLYGLTLVARSGVGLGDRPPQVGDPPQVWVQVDLTKPVVRLDRVDVGQGQDAGKLTISYDAYDANLGRQPITLSYATDPAGPWQPIAEHVENTKRYVWQMPSGIPYQFYVKVEAVDRAGNVGSDQTAQTVKVDLSQPKSVILDVGPAK